MPTQAPEGIYEQYRYLEPPARAVLEGLDAS